MDSVVAVEFTVDVSSEGGAVIRGIAEEVLQLTDVGEHSCERPSSNEPINKKQKL